LGSREGDESDLGIKVHRIIDFDFAKMSGGFESGDDNVTQAFSIVYRFDPVSFALTALRRTKPG
jgi:predicted Ser/Thr protein kinase